MIEEACTASLNVAVTLELVATPVALVASVSLVTVGHRSEAVVKDHENGAVMVTPDVLSAPLTVAV